MSGNANVDLGLIARPLGRLVSDVASMRDDMTVLTAIAMRQDNTLGVADRSPCHAHAA